MNNHISLLIFFLFASHLGFSQKANKIFKHSVVPIQLSYSENWKLNKSSTAVIYLEAKKGDVEKGAFCPRFFVYASQLQEVEKTLSLGELLLQEEKTVTEKKATGEILDSESFSIETIGGKKWIVNKFLVNLNGRKMKGQFWETLHNSMLYTISYYATENDFENFRSNALETVNSFSFLKKDETVYNENVTPAPIYKDTIASALTTTKQKDNPKKEIKPVEEVKDNTTNVSDTEGNDPEEAERINKCAKEFVSRKSYNILEIKATNGKIVDLGNFDPGTDYEEYTINYFFESCVDELDAYLINVGGWESVGNLLINKKNGTRYEICNSPILSPDNKKFIAISSGEDEAGYDANFVEIWINNNGVLSQEFEFKKIPWGPVSAKWIDANTIILEAVKYDGATDKTSKLASKRLVFVNNKWMLSSDGKLAAVGNNINTNSPLKKEWLTTSSSYEFKWFPWNEVPQIIKDLTKLIPGKYNKTLYEEVQSGFEYEHHNIALIDLNGDGIAGIALVYYGGASGGYTYEFYENAGMLTDDIVAYGMIPVLNGYVAKYKGTSYLDLKTKHFKLIKNPKSIYKTTNDIPAKFKMQLLK